jgi:hypothetical protein
VILVGHMDLMGGNLLLNLKIVKQWLKGWWDKDQKVIYYPHGFLSSRTGHYSFIKVSRWKENLRVI